MGLGGGGLTRWEAAHSVLEGTRVHKSLLEANGEVSTHCTGVCQVHNGHEQAVLPF